MYDYPFFYITEKPNNLPAFPQKKALNADRNNSNNTKQSSASRHMYCSTTGKPTRSFATERVSLDSV